VYDHCRAIHADSPVEVHPVWTGHLALTAAHVPLDLDIWVDAAMSYGIVVYGQWAAWWLVEGWKAADCDIGWAKTLPWSWQCYGWFSRHS